GVPGSTAPPYPRGEVGVGADQFGQGDRRAHPAYRTVLPAAGEQAAQQPLLITGGPPAQQRGHQGGPPQRQEAVDQRDPPPDADLRPQPPVPGDQLLRGQPVQVAGAVDQRVPPAQEAPHLERQPGQPHRRRRQRQQRAQLLP